MEMQMEFIRKLPSPQELMQDYPLGAEASAVKTARDKEIREIITDIQKASDTLIQDSEKGTAQIDNGCESAKSLEKEFESIMQSSQTTADSSNQILTNVEQLTGASEQIFVALQEIAKGIESFSQNITSVSTASESVKDIASLL